MIELAPDTPERERNRWLRRLDWRFLLHEPAPRRVCSLLPAGQSSLKQAIQAFDLQPAPPADLAVVQNPTRARLAQAFAALQPGGELYGEWRFPMGGERAVRHALTQAGFVDIACYWAWPVPGTRPPSFWLPVDAPHAIRAFLALRPATRSKRITARRTALRYLWQAAYRAGVVAPLQVTARRPNGQQAPLITMLHENGIAASRVSSLLLTGGARSVNKVVRLLFHEQQPEPVAVVKYPRVPASIEPLRREARTLQLLHQLRPVPLAGVPEVLHWNEQTGQLTEHALMGKPLYSLLTAQSLASYAMRASDWLSALVYGPATNDWIQRIAQPALAYFKIHFGAVIDVQRVDDLEAALQRVGVLPTTFEQRDFSPWNVLLDRNNQLIVLDWESAEPQGLPGLDLIYFLSYLIFTHEQAMESKKFRASYLRLRDRQHPVGALVHRCLAHYAQVTGLNSDVLRVLWPFTWVLHARSEYAHMQADCGGTPTRAQLETSLFVDLWRTEMALFGHSNR